MRFKARRGQQVAVVATACKIAVLVWHLLSKNEDYALDGRRLPPGQAAAMEIKAGLPWKRGGNKPGQARDYNIKSLRDAEVLCRAGRAWSERLMLPNRLDEVTRMAGLAGHETDRWQHAAVLRCPCPAKYRKIDCDGAKVDALQGRYVPRSP
jgi:hypothetical protein